MRRLLALSLVGQAGLLAAVAFLVAATVPDRAEVERAATRGRLSALVARPRPPIRSLVRPSDADHLESVFERLDFDLEAVRSGAPVPRVYVMALPADLAEVESVRRRKSLFLRSVLPLVLAANEELALLRRRLLALQTAMRTTTGLPAEDRAWLARVKRRYDLGPGSGLAPLLRRVDVVPVSLALAQAIEESGWGGSRFARVGNALYGQRTYSAGIAGLAPADGDERRFKVRSFLSLLGAVRSYMHNLNTQRTYRALRALRARWRGLGQAPDGYVWAGALRGYSERGREYVARLRAIMRDNALSQFDGRRFRVEPDRVAGADRSHPLGR